MAKDVTIQLVDVVNAFSGNKALKQSEPLMLRRSDAIKTVTGSTKPSYRLAVSPADNNAIANDSGLSDAVIQFPTVDEVNKVHADLSQGFIDVTVKYGLYFYADGTTPYYLRASGHPDGTIFVNGDLALAPYNQETLWGQEWFKDAGDRNGVIPVAGTAVLTGEGYPLYRYDGTGWLPCVLNNLGSTTKYRIKVEKDYAYLGSIINTSNVGNYVNINDLLAHCTNTYELIYYPNTPSAGVMRSARIVGNSKVDWRIYQQIEPKIARLNCGNTLPL